MSIRSNALRNELTFTIHLSKDVGSPSLNLAPQVSRFETNSSYNHRLLHALPHYLAQWPVVLEDLAQAFLAATRCTHCACYRLMPDPEV